MRSLLDYIPGILFASAVALLAIIIEKNIAFLALIGAPALAIFLGIIIGNLPFDIPLLAKGTRFSESRLLELSVMLLGTSVTFQTLAHLGVNGLLFIILQMTITIISAIFIGRSLHLSQATSLLMAAGNGVCGSSAIAATAPVVGATNDERGLVITIVNLMGTIMMFTMPMIAWILFQNATTESSALIGGTLQSVGQVVASASMISSDVNNQAIIYKIVRIIFIIAVVIIFSKIRQQSDQKERNSDPNDLNIAPNERTISQRLFAFLAIIPWYVYAFLLFCLINSLITLPEIIVTPATTIRNAFELIALAAIGLRLNLSLLKSQGKALLIYAFSLGSVQTISAIILVLLLI